MIFEITCDSFLDKLLNNYGQYSLCEDTYTEVWFGKEDGRLLFIGKNRYMDGSVRIRKTKDGSMRYRRPDFLEKVMEHLILFGSMDAHIGADDKPLPGAYFCVDGKEFRERDPKDGRRWLKGVEFDVTSAYYCQVDMDGVRKAQEVLRKKRAGE